MIQTHKGVDIHAEIKWWHVALSRKLHGSGYTRCAPIYRFWRILKTIDRSVRDTGDRCIAMRTDGILEQIVPDDEVAW